MVKDLYKEWVEEKCREPPIIAYLDQEEALHTFGGEETITPTTNTTEDTIDRN